MCLFVFESSRSEGSWLLFMQRKGKKEGTNGQLNFGDSIVCKVQLKPSLKHKRAERTLPLLVLGGAEEVVSSR